MNRLVLRQGLACVPGNGMPQKKPRTRGNTRD
ncbi:hypothetical protein GA0115257_10671, partial [Streptomyces sp. LcepLS]